ncbi:Uncharacterised protein [Mycobacteroides abscessus subsp. abscessus]|nr:Uncharacterised protein [Mycobacteroides abscessus subsp. abscessus]
MRPAALDERLRLGRTGIPPDHRGAAQLVGAQHRHVPCMRIGRTRLGKIVVAVVPHHHQSQIDHRREHRSPGADHHSRLAA